MFQTPFKDSALMRIKYLMENPKHMKSKATFQSLVGGKSSILLFLLNRTLEQVAKLPHNLERVKRHSIMPHHHCSHTALYKDTKTQERGEAGGRTI